MEKTNQKDNMKKDLKNLEKMRATLNKKLSRMTDDELENFFEQQSADAVELAKKMSMKTE